MYPQCKTGWKPWTRRKWLKQRNHDWNIQAKPTSVSIDQPHTASTKAKYAEKFMKILNQKIKNQKDGRTEQASKLKLKQTQ